MGSGGDLLHGRSPKSGSARLSGDGSCDRDALDCDNECKGYKSHLHCS